MKVKPVCVCVAQRQKHKKHKVWFTNVRILLILNHAWCMVKLQNPYNLYNII